ncbi:MAG TPA: hypothetical protein VFU55_04735 [Terracidiphilus sp.]|nr:hypothetical protein [Terracidiphilus sp.]
MRIFAAILLLAAGQLISLQPKHVLQLAPHKDTIEAQFDGCLVELINSPHVIHLPADPPGPGTKGEQWSVTVKNFGPRAVTITADRAHFSTVIYIGQTLQIASNGTRYLLEK